MTGFGYAIMFLFIIGYFILMLGLLIVTIVQWRSRKNFKVVGSLFLVMTLLAGIIYLQNVSEKRAASIKFFGDYHLRRLDGLICDSCTVKVKDGHTYDIIVKNKLVGHGKWNLGTGIDLPGYFLEIENGPKSVIWEHDTIDYIDRK